MVKKDHVLILMLPIFAFLISVLVLEIDLHYLRIDCTSLHSCPYT